MPDIAKLKKLILQGIEVDIRKQGFINVNVPNSFRLVTDFGWASFHLAFIFHNKIDFEVTADVALRFDAVENLVNEENYFLTKKEKSQTATMGSELGNLRDSKQCRWNVSSESDIKRTVESIYNSFTTVGLPYIKKYSNIEEAFKALSKNDRSGWLHSPFHLERCKRALTIAFIMEKSDLIAEVMNQSKIFLHLQNEDDKTSFEKFANRLFLPKAVDGSGDRHERDGEFRL